MGATWRPAYGGVNFAVYAENARGVSVCLFDKKGVQTAEIPLPYYTNQVWHGFVRGLAPGQHYGLRAYGEYNPLAGNRYNPTKLLLDPYARQITAPVEAHVLQLGYARDDTVMDNGNSAPVMPKCVVTVDRPVDASKPAIPWRDMVIYEAHVKGFTFANPDIDKELRGLFSGMAAPAAIKHLKSLGVSSVELLPIHAFARNGYLMDKKLANYWGYDPISYFAPHPTYGTPDSFRDMVRVFHEAGIEVLMDVVYNHTGEGGYMGPHLSFRGLDNRVYYRLRQDSPNYYEDHTGCGASFNVEHPAVMRLVLDSLRYWSGMLDVDGFRFDLAPVLARQEHGFNYRAPFLQAMAQDPALSRLKLIAEPWDVGLGGYQVGAFPTGWSEWNDQYRDTLRRFWKGDTGQLAAFTSGLAGSAQIFNHHGRQPSASVNFITAHDGFTMADLVSYNHKHNSANKEGGRDGTDSNWSWNSGAEGPTKNADVQNLRERRQKAMLASLLLSQGTPMLLGGDEIGRSQRGNNNAYCQDSPISWFDWKRQDADLIRFVRSMLALRRANDCLRREDFFGGAAVPKSASRLKDIQWLTPEAGEMSELDWHKPYSRAVSALIAGARGQHDLFIIFNASDQPISWKLPRVHDEWDGVFNTSLDDPFLFAAPLRKEVEAPEWSVVMLRAEAVFDR
ncbi:glycogen operon protein GlgX homolog [Alphaproteobacteria bacterium]|nr:glycogen operon protein GlgX homolog [Alphaproteobacteria bacterium]